MPSATHFYHHHYKPPCDLHTYITQTLTKVFTATLIHKMIRVAEEKVFPPPLVQDEARVIFYYSYELEGEEQIYAKVNQAMRDLRDLEVFRPFIYFLNEALKKLPSFSGIVYRGIDCKVVEENYRTGKNIVWPAFSSTSVSEEVGKKFCTSQDGTLFMIYVNNGRNIAKYSCYSQEQEILLLPNSTFLIKNTLSNLLKNVLKISNELMVVELCEEVIRKPSQSELKNQDELLRKYNIGFKKENQTWKELLELVSQFNCSGNWIFEATLSNNAICRYQVTMYHNKQTNVVSGSGIFKPQHLWNNPIPFNLSGRITNNFVFDFLLEWKNYGTSHCKCIFDIVNMGPNIFQGTYSQGPELRIEGAMHGYRIMVK